MNIYASLCAGCVLAATAFGAAPVLQSKFLAVGFSRTAPAFSAFAVDSLGRGKFEQNPVLAETNAVAGIALDGHAYTLNGRPVWRIACGEKALTLRSDHTPGVEAPPFTLTFNQKANHATLLGLMKPGERQMALPCVLHLPDMGTLRITCNARGAKLDYDARRRTKPAFVRVAFPAATAQQPRVEYRMEVAAIHPKLPGIGKNALYDGFRRDWLNIFQVNPRVQMLANNASSDPCSFTLFEYADLARHTPPLAPGLTANDLIRMTLDRYLAGALGYGQIGFACKPTDADLIPWPTPWTSLDTLPSFLISACNYVNGSRDLKWARANYAKLAAWGREMFAADKDGNGLIEYPGTGNYGDRPTREKRPSNWWDTINFGHEDAFSNALAYHAATLFAELARKLKHGDDAQFFAEKAAKLRAAYAPTFLNPATGVLAGWKSADGQLHDYWFTFVQGAAITYGLLDDKTANAVMDRLLAKMREVGYTRFNLGLPGNLAPVKKGDYVDHDTPPQVHGVPKLEDGSDGFQFYENGGATGCWAYYTAKALYKLGRVGDARRIFHPMLAGYARGEFQGFGENGMSRDWRDWKGGCHGYEGLLVDNYHALLAALDDVKAPALRPAAEARDLILVAGQSNAVGFDARPSELPADDADKAVMFWWRCGDPPPDAHDSTSGSQWTHLQPQALGDPIRPRKDRQYGNFAQADGGFGPEIGLARELRAKERRPLAIVKAAFSGTAMAQDWNHADPGDGGSCYRALVAETKAAIAAAKARGVTLRLRALVWVQGESDSNAKDAPNYTRALGDMIVALRKDLRAPRLIALLGVNTRFGNDKNPFVPKIIEAQQALAAKDRRCAYVDTVGAETLLPSRTHFTAAGTLEVGKRFADALLAVEAKVKGIR